MCEKLGDILYDSISHLELEAVTSHRGGTYVCMEGPAFSTKAESYLYRSWGAAVVGMTNLPEAKLAREAEISYATLALVTDYDCWHEDHESVTVERVVEYLRKNAVNAQTVIKEAVRRINENPPVSDAHSALKDSILTPLNKAPTETKDKLKVLLEKYL